jgi:hypothetical protein
VRCLCILLQGSKDFPRLEILDPRLSLRQTRPSLNICVERAIILSCASSELIPAADWYKSRLLENSLDPSSMNCTIFPARLRAARPSRAILVENFGSLRDANLQVRVMM